MSSQSLKPFKASHELLVQPHSYDLEAYVLGSCLMAPDLIPVVVERLTADAFRATKHELIFSIISKRFKAGQATDMMAVIEELRLLDQLDLCEGAYGVSSLTNKIITIHGIEDKLELLVEFQLQREAQRLGLELTAKSQDHPGRDLLLSASKKIHDLLEKNTRGTTLDVADTIMRLIRARDTQEEGRLIGLDMGIPSLNRELSGLCAPDLIVIAARPGAGKTALALNLVDKITISAKIPGAFFSLEMSTEQLLQRLESIRSGVFFSKIRHNSMDEYDRAMLAKADEAIASSPLIMDDTSAITISELRAKAHIYKRKYDIQYLVIDYLQLMSGEDKRGGNREQDISAISRGLKGIAKDLMIPVIALSQLSREVEKRPNKMPQLSDLRESGAIEQDADAVLFLMRPEYYKMLDPVILNGVEYDSRGLIITELAKNRHNQPTTVALGSNLGCFQIYDQAAPAKEGGKFIPITNNSPF
jgi:replicative DNA helicase